MSIDFSAKIVDFDGNPIRPNPETTDELTLRDACVRALCLPYDDERSLSPEDKFKRGQLASQIYKSDSPLDLKTEDIALIKRLIGKAYTPIIVFHSWPLLDAAEK